MTYSFRDSTSLAKWTKWSLYAQMAISVIAIISGYLEYQVLDAMGSGTFETQEALINAAEASDSRQGIVGLAQLVVFLTTAILVLRWIHRANWNARALGAKGMQFTPGWSVGWHFVPFANLWKPYQAFKEIWVASADPKAWRSEDAPDVIKAWWGFWLLSGFLGNASFRLAMRAQELPELMNASVVTIFSDIATLPLCAVFIFIVSQVERMQSEVERV